MPEKFRSKRPLNLTRMANHLVESRLKELEALAHELNGAGGGQGFPAISKAAHRVAPAHSMITTR